VGKRNRHTFDSQRAREASRLAAEARARRRRAEQNPPPRPGGGSEEGRVSPPRGPAHALKVREDRDLRQLSEDALVDLLKSPSETARVQAAKVLHERSLPRLEPEPVGDAPRAHSLVDVLELAARASLGVSEEDVIGAIRRGTLSRDAERSPSNPSRHGA
jgi:hypothetical protein